MQSKINLNWLLVIWLSIVISGCDAFASTASGSSADSTINSGQWQKSGANIYYTDGNVGIGTNSPESSSSLHIKKDGTPTIQYIGSGDNTTGRLKLSYYPTKKFSRITSWGTDGYKEMQIAASNVIINGQSDETGKVGIGTESPMSILAVKGLPISPPDSSGNAGVVCVTNNGNFWLDNDGVADCN